MHIVLIIFGALLLLFGGGCTLIVLWLMISEPGSIGDAFVIVPYWIPLGLLPLVIGWLLVRWGVKSRRAKRDQK